ncbi:MAG: NAD(P)-dependent dehydrogenase (short-subunit alcohol dehydrogenase family) [Pseudohongiellaceae bacterium]|jgi:NAD(P)-dependent dehydrogenase (short-subunit alcohol dehydrogenase family)
MTNREQKKLNSGFAAKSEPQQILAGKDLSGKVVIVTGGYSGIGLETTRALVNAGAKVHVPVRSPEKAKVSLNDIQGVTVGAMDLADIDSVKAYAKSVIDSEAKIDLLINNAGIMACPEALVGNGWESQFGVNHIGHFVLTNALLPLLQQAQGARVVCLSSIAHRRSDVLWDDIHFTHTPYEKWTAYAQAKTANALFARALDIKFSDKGIKALSVHPGGILTPLQRHLGNEEMQALGWTDAEGNLSEMAAAMFKSTTQGCTTSLWAATSELLNDVGGVYCEDCDVANLATQESPRFIDVAPWAASDEGAMKLWDLTEAMLKS